MRKTRTHSTRRAGALPVRDEQAAEHAFDTPRRAMYSFAEGEMRANPPQLQVHVYAIRGDDEG